MKDKKAISFAYRLLDLIGIVIAFVICAAFGYLLGSWIHKYVGLVLGLFCGVAGVVTRHAWPWS